MITAVENLTDNQQQLDADGCMVGVSRQALDEALEYIAALEENLSHVATDAARYRWVIKNSYYGITDRQQVVLYLKHGFVAPDSKFEIGEAIDKELENE